MWLSTDDVIISIGLLSYMVSAISDLQIGMECHVGVTNCTDRFNDYLYPVSASFELLHGISQGMLLLTFTEIDKTLWAILPDNSTIGKLLSPLHYLVILNAFYVIYGIFPFNKLRFMLGDKSILTQLYRETDHVLALSGYILFRLHSAYVIVKFYFT